MTHVGPNVAIFTRQGTDRDPLVLSSQRNHAFNLTNPKKSTFQQQRATEEDVRFKFTSTQRHAVR